MRVDIIVIYVCCDAPHGDEAQRRDGRGLQKIAAVESGDLCTYGTRDAAIVKKAHERADRVEPIGAAALVEFREKGAGNGGEDAV